MTGSTVAPLPTTRTGDNGAMISDSDPEGPIFGRDGEIGDFASLLHDTARSSITLLGGDAGIGKTRLVQEIAATCRAGAGIVLVGRCLDLGDSSAAYLPIIDIARTLQTLPATAGLQTIMPAEGLRPLEFFDSVAAMLDQLATLAPALVVLEDVHWADRATRELLTYLFTRDVAPGVHLVATYRTDDLHRRHPLRPTLAEWSRLPTVRRVLLNPLDTVPARALVDHLRPGLDEGAAGEIIRRSGGNPFFTEELVNASMQHDSIAGPALPGDLADLLLVRTDSLDEDPRRVLRAAAVAGSLATDAAIECLAGLPAERLHAALRAAIDAHLLVATADGNYTFRHALLAEAVYDDLLPGERIRLHDKLTELLLRRAEPAESATLAMHAEQAGRLDTALHARVAAGKEALETAAPSNAARHFEKAIALATRHPELTDVPGDLPERAAEAHLAGGDPHRAADLIRDALRSFTGASLERARLLRLYLSALLLTDLPTMHTMLGVDGLPDEADRLLDVAIGWVRDGHDTVLLGQLLALKAHYLVAFERYDEATVTASDALAIGRTVDEPSIISDAMTTQAKLDGIAGDLSSALTTLEQVREQAAADGDIRAELRAMHQLAGLLARTDQYRDAAATFGRAIQRAKEVQARTELYGIDAIIFAATLAAKLGDWARVDELLAETDDLPPLARASTVAAHLAVDVARGRLAEVRDAHEELRPYWRQDMFIMVNDAPGMIEVLGSSGDLAGAVAMYDDATETVQKVWRLSVFDAQIRMSALLLSQLADAVTAKPRETARWADRVDQLEATLQAVLSVRGKRDSLGLESRAWFARARAELARFRGDNPLAVSEYRTAVALFAEAEFPYEHARAELMLSRALHSADDRQEARRLADHALETARTLGATRLIAEVRGGRSRTDSSRSATLTPREQDVLGLVAAGLTNGQIAAQLFISTKTASVHVSNILAKLGAATRTESVELARRRGLLD